MYKVNIYECSHSNLQLPPQILGKKLKEFILVVGEKELGSRRSLQDGHDTIPEKKSNQQNPRERIRQRRR
jgi:hypothetical protein